VTSTDVQIRRVTPDEAPLYRRIRLEALRLSPEAFGSTFERESAQSDAWFAERLATSEVLGAWHGADLVGVVGFRAQEGSKEAHKGLLWGMYVQPAFRKEGLAGRLLDALLALAKGRVELVQLAVWDGNIAARRLYERFGFVAYGTELNALKQNGVYYNEVLMAKALV
jgi:ribosomal protein S18 acetylase RimI-like enzyme